MIMRLSCLILILSITFILLLPRIVLAGKFRSENFSLYHYQNVTPGLETRYKNIKRDLGVTRSARITVIVYESRAEYANATGKRNARGHVNFGSRTIYTYRQSNLMSTITHEITHIVENDKKKYPSEETAEKYEKKYGERHSVRKQRNIESRGTYNPKYHRYEKDGKSSTTPSKVSSDKKSGFSGFDLPDFEL